MFSHLLQCHSIRSANDRKDKTGISYILLPCYVLLSRIQEVEAEFSIPNGRTHNAEVIYGDTDSVMVKFGPTDLAQVMALGTLYEASIFDCNMTYYATLGKEAADFVTQKFVKPIKLEFEKVYYPYLLISKKRYAGLYWTKLEKYDKMDSKGIEVRLLALGKAIPYASYVDMICRQFGETIVVSFQPSLKRVCTRC